MNVSRMRGIKKHVLQISMIVLYIGLISSVVMLMRHVQNLLNSDIKINLMEVVTQNKDVITSRLELEMNELESLGNRLVDRMSKDENPDFSILQDIFLEYTQDNEDPSIYISDLSGNAIFYSGTKVDISGRKYFKLASEGVDNISDRVMSRRDGNDIFVFSVPLISNNKIIGTMQKFYTPEEMYELCALSLYSSEGYMYVINKEGYILISTSQNEYSKENENYFRLLYAQENPKESEQIQQDILNERDGFIETVSNGERTFSAYTPIKDIHDWYLISSVATSAVSSNSRIVIRMFYFILFMVILIFGGSLWAFLGYKNRQQENLERIAFVDGVTLGKTFSKFVVDLREHLQEKGDAPCYLLKFDIDNFKYVNNFYGFDTGDKILRQIYRTIESRLTPGESIARISSDNFVICLDDVEEERLKNILESTENDEGISILLSSGIYKITDPNESVNLMVDKASAAAATMKNALHKKVCFYSEEFDQRMIHNEQLKQSVQQALLKDEMIPFYQPKVDINTGEITGAEALCRWRTSEGKLIPPFEFIPMCEKTGLVTELDFCIFDKVLRYQQKRMAEGACVPISVNFSRLHLMDKDFMEKVMQKINKYQVPPSLIELELTESAIFENYEVISKFIAALHKMGFLVSMDDFGSGYSSLNMLKDIPIDVLKIDKGFLDESSDSKKQRIIFSTIAGMAQKLDLKVVVEGVEEMEQVELMRECGCSIAQGYFYSKPLDEDSFDKMCREGIKC